MDSEENHACVLTACYDSRDELLLNKEGSPNNTFLFQKYTSGKFIDKKDINHQETSQVLKQIKIKNINRVMIGHFNVNVFAAKLDAIKIIITGNIDIMVFGETKLDDSYPMAQLLIDGFGKPFRLDRNSYEGDLLINVRSDIPCKQRNKHEFSNNIEGIFVEINIRKSIWLLLGTYHPQSQNKIFYFRNIRQALDMYTQNYDKIVLAGDFNAEKKEIILNLFMDLYDLQNLANENTCFKSVENPSCVDLLATNCSNSFQSTFFISTGISDCHKMIITVLKTTFKKARSKEIIYGSYKNFHNYVFRKELRYSLAECGNYNEFERCFLEVLNAHVPIKQRLVRVNEVPYMTKALKKATANRSTLENQYFKNK